MKRLLAFLMGWFLWLGCALPASSQSVVASTNPERRGTGTLSVAYQSYYNRINGTTVSNIQGTELSFRHFFPRSGLLSVQLEPVSHGGAFGLGENYVHWDGLPWQGRHWDFAAGDFHVATATIPSLFTNLNLPQLSLRGGQATARTDNWSSSFYYGKETLSQGNRVPYRVVVPQNALGFDTAGHPADRLQLGFRLLHLASSPARVAEERLFFPNNRRFTQSTSFATQARVRLNDSLDWYTEAALGSVATLSPSVARRSPLSMVFGPALHTTRFSLKANYTNQGTGYLPVLGYYVGDRRGPTVEGLLRLGPVTLFGNWIQARNNREHDISATDFDSRQASGGFQVRLPSNLMVNASVSKIHLESRSAETGFQISDNRQLQLMVAKPLARHNLHATWQRTDSESLGAGQRLNFVELEDNYTWKRLSAGGAVRWQRLATVERKDSLFFRNSIQLQLRHLSLYGYWEQGKDLANETLFATNFSSTSVVGMSWVAPGGTNVRLEGFRNHLHSELNPESLFVLGNRGIAPGSLLSQSNDWSVFLRVVREFEWGEPMRLDSQGRPAEEAPLTGTLAGYVRLRTLAGESGAPDVWVRTDSGVAIQTDAQGHFTAPNVPLGTRTVALDLDRLPADLNPSGPSEVPVQVNSGRFERIELEVTPLQSVEGIVQGPDGQPAGPGIVLRLQPGGLYTSTDLLGRFGFYNLPEGDYEVRLAVETLSEPGSVVPVATVLAAVRYGIPAEPVVFQYAVVQPPPKPTRKVVVGVQQVVPGSRQPVEATRKGRGTVRTTAQGVSKIPKPAASLPASTVGAKASRGRVIGSTGSLQQPVLR